MMLQQVMPLLAQVAGATHRLEIEKVTVLPGGAGDGGFARAAISASEQIKAATGFDLAAAAEKLGRSDREGRRPELVPFPFPFPFTSDAVARARGPRRQGTADGNERRAGRG